MTTATLNTLDDAVTAFRAKMAELAFAKASTQEVLNQLSALKDTLAANVSPEQVFNQLLFNDPNAAVTSDNQAILNSYINRLSVNEASGYINLIQNQLLGLPLAGLGTAASFVFAGSEYGLDSVTEGLTTATTQVVAATSILAGAVGLVTGGLGLATAVDDFLQLKAQGVTGDQLASATLGLANQSLGIAGNLVSIVQNAVVLGFYAADQGANATAAFAYGLIPSLSSAVEGASLGAVLFGSAVGLGGAAIALAGLGISAFNFAETVKGWQEADANGLPVSTETKALASTSFALNSLAGVVGVVAGLTSLAFPPAGVIIGIVGAVIAAIAAAFDWIVSLVEFSRFKDQVYVGTDGNDTILAKHLFSLVVDAGGGDDLIKPIPASGFGPAGSPDNIVNGGSGTDTLDVSGNDSFLFMTRDNGRHVNATTLGGSWVLNRYYAPTDSFSSQTLAAIVNIENVLGSDLRDSITGDAKNNLLVGRAGDDTIRGGEGDDVISGGAGFDDLDGGAGIDTISYALDGGDRNAGSNGAGVEINLDYQAVYSRASGNQIDRIANFENAIGSDGNDRLTGTAQANLLAGSKGSDALYGGSGNDTLSGGWGTDTLRGGADADTVDYRLDGDEAAGHAGQGFIIDLRAGRTTTVADPNLVTDYLEEIENVIGSNANDIIRGNDLANLLVGADGNDSISGDAGADVLSGGKGRDTLDGGEGIDTANLTGDDTGGALAVDLEKEAVYDLTDFFLNGPVQDVVRNIENVITGGGDDYIYGNAQNNVLITGKGGDYAEGRQGNDTLVGGDGFDYLYGGGDNDLLSGGSGDDRLYGDAGIDTVAFNLDAADAASGWRVDLNGQYTYRLAGDDVTGAAVQEDRIRDVENLIGADRNDWFTGNGQANALIGNGGNDRLEGAGGNDTILGGSGNDSLTGGADNDLLSGGLGVDTIDGGEGIDTINYALDATDGRASRNGAGVDVNLATGQTRSRWQGDVIDTLSNIENVVGSDGDDAIIGNDQANLLIGQDGNDLLAGGKGNDSLLGGRGDDSLDGGGDDDFLSGGYGRDTLNGDTGVDTVSYMIDSDETAYTAIEADLQSGNVTIRVGATVYQNEDKLIAIENLIATNGNDTVFGDGAANQIVGMDGHDVIDGREGHDILIGGAGNDSLTGGAGNDYLSGGVGADTLDGGADSDTVFYNDEDARWSVDLAAGTAARGGTAGGAFLAEDTLRNIENIITGLRDDIITGSGLANQIGAGAGQDTVLGGAGNDTVSGDAGNDSLSGGADDDLIIGGSGNDTIDGGTGRDTAAYSEGLSADLFAAYGANLAGFDITVDATGATVRARSTSGSVLETDTLTNVEGILGSDRAETTRINAYVTFSTDAAKGVDTLDLSGLGSATGAYVNLGTGNVTLVQSGGTIVQSHLNYENATGTDTFDTLIGTDLDNVIKGGGGNDILSGLGGADRLEGGTGIDTVSYVASASGVSVNLATSAVSGGEAAGDTLISIENIIGSRYNDVLTGDAGANTLTGGAGNDLLTGGAGIDTFTFAKASGSDVIQDFTAEDVIQLQAVAGIGSFAQLLGIATQVGSDVVLHLSATDQLVVKNYALNQLQADDFQFA